MGKNRDFSKFPNAITVLDNGNVGIGTSTPATYTIAPQLVVDSGASGGGLTIKTGTTSSTTNYGGVFFADGTTGSEQYRGFIQYNHNFNTLSDTLILGTAGTERMYITSSGNVGIGTSTPTEMLHLNNSSTNAAFIRFQNTGGSGVYIGGRNNDMELYAGGSERMRITSAGNVGINNSTPTGKLHINSNDTPTISGTNPTGAFIIQSTASTALTMGVFQNNPFYGWMQMRHGNLSDIAYGLAIQPLGGNVGIGTSSPLSRLHIGPEGSAGGNTPTIIMSSASGTKPMMLITEYTARSGGFGYDSSNFMTLATEASVTAGFKFKVGSSFQSGLLNTGTEALVINSSAQITKPSNPAFRAYYSFNGSWTLSTNATFVFDATEYNIGNCYNTSNGRFTAPVSGVYHFSFYSIYYGPVTNAFLQLIRNGGVPTSGYNVHFSNSVSGWDNVTYNTTIYLNAGDWVAINNGSTTQYHGDDWSSFSGYLVG